jgi:UDP:flavonoid glycosyltransferase YjiC (YdhE family)
MRVLLVSAPLIGHVFPLVPLARALMAAGHEVCVATGADGMAVAKAGVPTEDIAPGFTMGRIALPVLLRHPLIARSELRGRAGTRGVALLFGKVNDRIADSVVALASRFRPDLVLYEPLAVAGALAAARLGVPAVLHENSLYDGPTLVRVTSARLGAALRRHGVAELPADAATIVIAPPSVVPGRAGWPMRPVPYAAGTLDLPAPARPRVVVNRSTVGAPGGGLMPRVAKVAASVDAEFVFLNPDRATRIPANGRAVDWAPMPALLDTSAAVIHHGGAGTAIAALCAGVPQLVVNGAGDRRHNASLIATRGAGLATEEADITPDLITHLLSNRALKTTAEQVRAEVAAMPDPGSLVPRLERLAVDPPR